LFICKENFRYVFVPGKALKRRALPKSSPTFLNYYLTHALILVMPSTEGLTLHFVWSYRNIWDKKERGEFAQFGTLPFGQAHDTHALYYYLSFVSSYSNIQEKVKRGGELVQFGTALPAKALHVCLLLLLILFFLLFFLFVFSGLKHNRRHDLTSSWHPFSLLKHLARSGLQR
jgi:hypothetical protein